MSLAMVSFPSRRRIAWCRDHYGTLSGFSHRRFPPVRISGGRADFAENPTCEVRRIPLLQRRVNRAGRGKRRTRPAQLVIVLLLPSSGALELAEALLQSR